MLFLVNLHVQKARINHQDDRNICCTNFGRNPRVLCQLVLGLFNLSFLDFGVD